MICYYHRKSMRNYLIELVKNDNNNNKKRKEKRKTRFKGFCCLVDGMSLENTSSDINLNSIECLL